MSVQFTYHGQAPSKANYRFSRSEKGRKKWAGIMAFEEEIGVLALLASGNQLRRSMGKKATVTTVAYSQRADADNIQKSVLDGLEGVMFLNDKDVDSILRTVRDNSEPRLEIEVNYELRGA